MRLIARGIVICQRKFLALFQLNFAVGKLAKAHLRSLGIKDERDDLSQFLGCLTNAFNAAAVLLMIAMRKIEARQVHAIFDQRFDNSGLVCGRSLRTNDLRFLQHTKIPPI